jgi:hypothetical protein
MRVKVTDSSVLGSEAREVMQAPGRWEPLLPGPSYWRTSRPSQDRWTSPAACDRRPGSGVTSPGARRRTRAQRYPADPPTVEEIIIVMCEAGPGRYADRTRGLIAILWAGWSSDQ